jgi:hypothetical protein
LRLPFLHAFLHAKFMIHLVDIIMLDLSFSVILWGAEPPFRLNRRQFLGQSPAFAHPCGVNSLAPERAAKVVTGSF